MQILQTIVCNKERSFQQARKDLVMIHQPYDDDAVDFTEAGDHMEFSSPVGTIKSDECLGFACPSGLCETCEIAVRQFRHELDEVELSQALNGSPPAFGRRSWFYLQLPVLGLTEARRYVYMTAPTHRGRHA